VEHQSLPELRGHVPGTGLIPLYNLHRDADLLQSLGQPQPDAAATKDHHFPDRGRIGGDGLDHLADVPSLAYQKDVIPGF
jgi:hypothetical protein